MHADGSSMALTNQTGSTTSSDSDEDFVFADLVYMALLNQDDTEVLMVQSEANGVFLVMYAPIH